MVGVGWGGDASVGWGCESGLEMLSVGRVGWGVCLLGVDVFSGCVWKSFSWSWRLDISLVPE